MTHLPSLLRRLLAASLLVLACLVLVAPAAGAHARLDPAATVRGVVLNGSHADAPVADVPVTLSAIAGGQVTQLATATSDAHGTFILANLQLDSAATYVLAAQFAGGTFETAEVAAADLTTSAQTLRVHDTTPSDAGISVARATLVVGEPNRQTGHISIAEDVSVVNGTDKAYVASVTPANGLPMNLLRFALPPNATNLVLGAGFATGQTAQVATGFGLAATVPPGTNEFAFAFDLPFNGGALSLPYKAEYATGQIVALVPPDVHLTSGDFAANGTVTAAGSQYQLLQHGALAAGSTSAFRLVNLPVPGETPFLTFGPLLTLGILLALLLALALAFYLARGGLPRVGVPALALPGAARAEQTNTLRREELLREHVALDEAHSAGKVGDDEYRARKDELRAELRLLLADRVIADAATDIPAAASVAAPARSAQVEGESRVSAAKGGAE